MATIMRVLHAMASGARGGGADHLLGLLPALRLQGVDCVAAVGNDGPLAAALRQRGFDVLPLNLMQSRIDLRQVRHVLQCVRVAAADVVHFHGTRAAFFGAAARRLWGRRPLSVYSAHGLAYRSEQNPARRLLTLAAEWVACQADGVVSVSSADLADLRRRGWLQARAIAHVPNAVDITRFAPGDKTATRALLSLPPAAFIVGTVSRLVPQKAVGDLFNAVTSLGAAASDVYVAVVGDGPQRDALSQHALARAGRVVFLGERDDVAQCLPAFDVFALTSRWEGEPIALLEALAAGLPCVATATAGATEILRGVADNQDDHKTCDPVGVLVPVGDAAALATAIAQLRADADRRAALAQRGRAHVLGRDVAAQAALLHAFYRGMLPPMGPAAADAAIAQSPGNNMEFYGEPQRDPFRQDGQAQKQ